MSGAQWQDLPADVLQSVDLASVLGERELATVTAFTVVVRASAFDSLGRHCAAAAPRECIGLLRGVLGRYRNLEVPLVMAAEPLDGADGWATGVRATGDAWAAAWPTLQDESTLLGWYHSHPGMGAFFSETDRRTQRLHFTRSWQVGLVMDPVRNHSAAYLGPDSRTASLLVC